MPPASRAVSFAFLGAFLCAVLAAAGACGSFAESEAPGADGGAEEASASSDGQARDGDAADASNEGGGGCTSKRWCDCQLGAAFCSDFDGPTLVGEWDQQVAQGGLLAAVASDRSAPNALLARTVASQREAGVRSVATVSKRIVGDVSKLALTLDVAAALPCARDDLVSYFVELRGLDATGVSPGAGKSALLVTKSGPKLLIKTGEESYIDLAPVPNTKPWSTLSIVVAGGTVEVRVDGQPVAPPAPFALTSSAFELVLGLSSSAGSDACEISYDNVVARFAP